MSERVMGTGYGGHDHAQRRRRGGVNAKAELAQELNGPVAACDQLTDQEAADLLALFRSARQAEAVALATAIDDMIDVLPRPFRTVARRIMFGDIVHR
ncbi:hypothetical protein ABIA39_004855 [Nocardia sp. GAS34]|jgi:hypothetical protein|uniref:hypothetical protein n=1 Tax=unclassified Nocardia TaxID=2637762 RepID=UPI003D210A60